MNDNLHTTTLSSRAGMLAAALILADKDGNWPLYAALFFWAGFVFLHPLPVMEALRQCYQTIRRQVRGGAGKWQCECILNCTIDPDIPLQEAREEVSSIKDGDYNASQMMPSHHASHPASPPPPPGGEGGAAALGMLRKTTM